MQAELSGRIRGQLTSSVISFNALSMSLVECGMGLLIRSQCLPFIFL
jgi:hypothetical protein